MISKECMQRLKQAVRLHLNLLYWRVRAIRSRHMDCSRGPVFIVGTGRSGTHFLAECLITHPLLNDLTNGRENTYVFFDVAEGALHQQFDSAFCARLAARFRLLVRAAYPALLVDQSHPSLWYSDSLAEAFPGARFIGIIRDPMAVAYSTLNHAGVRRWLEQGPREGLSPVFLGVLPGEEELFYEWSLEERSARRWAAHIVRLSRAVEKLGERLWLLNYEDLCRDPASQMSGIAKHLNLEPTFEVPKVRMESLTKKNALDPTLVMKAKKQLARFFEVQRPCQAVRDRLVGYDGWEQWCR